MLKVTYKLTVAGWSVDSAADPRTELVALDVARALNTPTDICHITVYTPPAARPSGLQAVATAAVTAGASALGLGGGGSAGMAVQVRGQDVKHGDPMRIELAAGPVSGTVLTGEVQAIHLSLGTLTLVGRTGMQRLANTRLNQVYESQSVGQIVRDLARQAGVQTGQIEDGSTYPYFVVHESKPLLRTLRELARREGFDLLFDTANKLVVKRYAPPPGSYTFRYGIDILDLRLADYQPATEGVVAYGESPASRQGVDTWHWLARDGQPFRGVAGQGAGALPVQDAAARTKDTATALATARLGAIHDAATGGRLTILGHPGIQPGEAITIADAPRPGLNGEFKVQAVRHIFNKRAGLLTFVYFSGQSGTQAGTDALGQFAGALGL
jgi:hypothetical protein